MHQKQPPAKIAFSYGVSSVLSAALILSAAQPRSSKVDQRVSRMKFMVSCSVMVCRSQMDSIIAGLFPFAIPLAGIDNQAMILGFSMNSLPLVGHSIA